MTVAHISTVAFVGIDAREVDVQVHMAEGNDKMLERLKDPVQRTRIKKEMNEPAATWENYWRGSGGGQGILLSQALNPELHKYEGMTFMEIGHEMGKDPTEAAIDFAIADQGHSEVVMATMSEDDVRAAVSNPLSTYGSDSAAQAEDGPLSTVKAHPRAFATFPRVLAQYARIEHTMSLEEALCKMTSFAASRVGIMDRGILRPGMMADIAVFDLAGIREVSTYQDPLHYAAGMRYVFVNGKPVVLDGKITDERPGRALRGPGYRRIR